jgi:hypothetical protein
MIALVSLLVSSRATRSQQPPIDDVLEKWFALYARHAESLEVRVPDANADLEMRAAPLLKYTNPLRGVRQHGSVYLWTRQGRPGMIASIWSALDRAQPDLRKLNYEWHSLSGEAVTAERDGEGLWNSSEPGIEWRDFESRPPAASRPLRLTQMRRIAQSFTTEIDAQEGELRLMSQPLYRYPEDTPGVIDGALFTFVMGTDPEVFVMVEARAAGEEEAGWQVAFARFTNWPVTVFRDQREIWKCDRATPFQRTGPYFLWFVIEELPADLSTVQLQSSTSGT